MEMGTTRIRRRLEDQNDILTRVSIMIGVLESPRLLSFRMRMMTRNEADGEAAHVKGIYRRLDYSLSVSSFLMIIIIMCRIIPTFLNSS